MVISPVFVLLKRESGLDRPDEAMVFMRLRLCPTLSQFDPPAAVVLQVLSFVAFVLEETISSCLRCSPLYFFEFVSCSAFLFTGLLLLLLSTCLHEKVGISCWPKVVRSCCRTCFTQTVQFWF